MISVFELALRCRPFIKIFLMFQKNKKRERERLVIDMDGDQEESDHHQQDDLNPLAFLGLQR